MADFDPIDPDELAAVRGGANSFARKRFELAISDLRTLVSSRGNLPEPPAAPMPRSGGSPRPLAFSWQVGFIRG